MKKFKVLSILTVLVLLLVACGSQRETKGRHRPLTFLIKSLS